MSRYFVTHIVPKDMISRCKIPAAACYFSYNLMEGGTFDKIICIPPANIHGLKSYYSDPAYDLMYSNLRNYSLFKILAPIVENIKAFKIINRNSTVWFYNITIISVCLIILLKLFKRNVKIYTIVLDYNPYERRNKYLLYFINKSNGIINLSCSPLFTVKNSCILPGVVPNHSDEPALELPLKSNFLLSGNLSLPISMLNKVLPAFAKVPDSVLHISGFNADEELISQYTKRYNNIIWHGVMEYNDYISLLHDCPFVLSTRDGSFPENLCNFPSKVIESLLHNRIIISTMHYEQLNGIDYIEIPSDVEGIAKSIKQIINTNGDDLMRYANQSSLVQKLFSNDVWKQKIREIERN